MEFRIADTFTDSLAKLNGQEQKAVKTTAFDLQMDPASPGMKFHKLDRAKDPNFWSMRVSRDIRLIVHKTAASLLLVFVGHHDPAYRWAERRKIERHPKTGAAQIVELREIVEEVKIRAPIEAVESEPELSLLFSAIPDEDLLGYGVPPDWLDQVKNATEDTLFDLTDHLPQEASEALLDIATGVVPQVSAAATADADPFNHPDAQRRFRLLTDVEELERALEFPWEKWTVFLHPAQRRYVERKYNGPARISGSAGTGKTIVAIHRAVFLARNAAQSRVLLTTFSRTLAKALKTKLNRLIGNEPRVRERIEITEITGIGRKIYSERFGPANMADTNQIRTILGAAASNPESSKFTPQFLFREWTDVVDAWQLKTWEEYRDVSRLGRKTRLGSKQRELLWSVFEKVRAGLVKDGLVTESNVFEAAASSMRDARNSPFDYVIVDEAQDMGVAEVRFLAALGADREESLFFAGDLGQRIFQQPFSWKSLGLDLRGRSHTLRINYRTSHQIRSHADRLLPSSLADVDGNVESRRGTMSVFNGPPPEIATFDNQDDEAAAVGVWIGGLLRDGYEPHEIGVFVRSDAQAERANAAVKISGVAIVELGESVETMAGRVSVGTMHLAKGLEFRAVAVMACDDEIVPLQERIETVTDDSDLEEVYNTERHLLYVACTRARDRIFVSGVYPASEFLDDLTG